MKRGKEEEKMMMMTQTQTQTQGPMFPRLHVKDTGKVGGPRAPPRNKMALYEQLTIPSHHRHHPLTTTTTTTNTNTIQVSTHEPNIYFPLYRPPPPPDDTRSRSRPPPPHPLEEDDDDDDFMVPIFSQPPTKHTPSHLHPMPLPTTTTTTTTLPPPPDDQTHLSTTPHPSTFLSKGLSHKHPSHLNYNTHDPTPHPHHSHLYPSNDFISPLPPTPHQLCHYNSDNRMSTLQQYPSPYKQSFDYGHHHVSHTSIHDSLSGFDLNPDDVVRVIGPKHFWKARTAIANQQRVFAVQIFELHRLLKVQKLIAESPDLLLEGSALLRKTSFKGSAVKKYSSECVAEAIVHKSAPKDDSQKAADKMEGTAENAVTKSPPIPPQNAIQPTAYQPSSVNTGSSFPPVNADPKMNPWSFHQPAPHQWLVPVMSPSEGLVYKPYPAHGCMGPVCGGCGPAGMTPMINPAYGMPNSHCQQGMGMPPGMNFGGQQGYFPPYGMPMPIMSPSMSGSTVEQLNQFSGPNPYGQTGQPAGTSVNYGGMQHQSSLNIPKQKNGLIAPAARSLPSKERELQGSTASSPSQRTQETGTVPPMEGRDALPLFPAAPTTRISEGSPAEKPARVIRVVPQKSTRESAARIFQSIQEERRQY